MRGCGGQEVLSITGRGHGHWSFVGPIPVTKATMYIDQYFYS